MKPLRLLALATAVCCGTASLAQAGDDNKTTATAASATHANSCCADKGAKTSATDASAAMEHCAMKGAKVSAVAAGAAGSCSAHGATMSAGMKCSAHANSTMAHAECSACEDWTTCEDEVRAVGATTQVVPLKNGAMIVYTAETPEKIKAVQLAVSRRHEKMLAALSSGDATKLCPDCKQLRGAMASGKLSREVVNVERGCMTLMTSADRAVVQKIHEMTGAQLAAHIKI